MMNPIVKDIWVKALREPKNMQCRDMIGKEVHGERSFCCLGLLLNETGGEFEKSDFSSKLVIKSAPGLEKEKLPGFALFYKSIFVDGYGMPDEVMRECIDMNDSRGKTFPEIADYVEVNA